jgi:hypothetical protein
LRAIRDIDAIPPQYFKKPVNTEDIWEARVTMGNNIFHRLDKWLSKENPGNSQE